MANTYNSKFTGKEVDEGVNIARNLAGTGGISVTRTGSGTTEVIATIDGSGKQDKLTISSNVHINSLIAERGELETLKFTSASTGGGLYFTNQTGATISYEILGGRNSGTAFLKMPDDIANLEQTIATQEYVRAHSSSYKGGRYINISGNAISLADNIGVREITLGDYSGNVLLYSQNGASGNVYFPKYGGTLATTSTTVASLGGKTGAIALAAGLSISGNTLKGAHIYLSGGYLCIDTE